MKKEYVFEVTEHEVTQIVSVIAESYEEAALKCCEQYGDEFDLTAIKSVKHN